MPSRRDLSLILGLFEIEKPYFNLDDEDRFRQLGTLSNKGVELSLAGQITKGLTWSGHDMDRPESVR